MTISKKKNNLEKNRSYYRKKNNIENVPSGNEVLFYGYKEPLKKFEGGFGYMGVISFNREKDKIQCHFCGLLFKSLNGHIRIHGLDKPEYIKRVELSPESALVGEGTRIKMTKKVLTPSHLKKLQKTRDIVNEKRKNGEIPYPRSGIKMSLETRNKRGNCPDQLLDKLEKTIKSYGHVPTIEEFSKFHHGKFLGAIQQTFGSYNKAIEKLGKRPNCKRHSKEELIKSMKDFYEVHKRTVTHSDMKRGLVPSVHAFYKNFKSLNDARMQAGIPILIGGTRSPIESFNYKKYE